MPARSPGRHATRGRKTARRRRFASGDRQAAACLEAHCLLSRTHARSPGPRGRSPTLGLEGDSRLLRSRPLTSRLPEAIWLQPNAWAEAIKRGAITPRPRAEPIERILAAGRRRNRLHVKTRLLLAKLKEARCEMCGLSSSRSQPLSLELHHINGDGLDNRLENLLLLCPNCHSQTDTWGGRNKKLGGFAAEQSRPRRRVIGG